MANRFMMYNIGKRLYMIFYYISCFCNNSWKVSQNQIRVRFGTVKSLNTNWKAFNKQIYTTQISLSLNTHLLTSRTKLDDKIYFFNLSIFSILLIIWISIEYERKEHMIRKRIIIKNKQWLKKRKYISFSDEIDIKDKG